MACKVELPKEIIKALIEQGINLRNRHIKAATNALIKLELEKEAAALQQAANTITDAK